MRRWLILSFLLLTAAKGDKKKPVEPTPPPPPVEVVEDLPPAPPPAPEVVKNASFDVTLTWANGSSRTGHVSGLERTVDFHGDQGWTTDERKLKLQMEVGTTEREVSWPDVATITITLGKTATDIDCSYDSASTPVMYDCSLRTTAAVVLKDGSKGLITGRHHWRLSFDNGESVELQIYKYTVRQAETDPEASEVGIYEALHGRIVEDLKTAALKSITVH